MKLRVGKWYVVKFHNTERVRKYNGLRNRVSNFNGDPQLLPERYEFIAEYPQKEKLNVKEN